MVDLIFTSFPPSQYLLSNWNELFEKYTRKCNQQCRSTVENGVVWRMKTGRELPERAYQALPALEMTVNTDNIGNRCDRCKSRKSKCIETVRGSCARCLQNSVSCHFSRFVFLGDLYTEFMKHTLTRAENEHLPARNSR